MHLRRTMSSSNCPRGNRSNENGHKDECKNKQLGGSSNESFKATKKQKRPRNHLTINWKESQSSVDNSRSSTPICGKGIRDYVDNFIYH